MDFDVITYANGAFLYEVFNGVASIFGHSSYMAAMATCMTAASIGIMISAVLQGRMVNLLWMLQAIFLYMMLVVPKVSVNIVDKTEIDAAFVSTGAFPSVRRVDNVPIGMAVVASSVSTFSSWATSTFETVFSLPDSMKYTANGPLFGQNLVKKMLSYQPNDASLNNNLQEFWKNCVFYDIGLGFYSFNDLSEQHDIVSFLKANTAMTRGFYQESGGVKAFTDCRTGISQIEQDLIQNQKDFKENSGARSSITMAPVSTTVQAGWTAMPVAFAYLSNVSRSASQLLIQSAMINSMDSGLQALAGGADADAAIQGYALARAERERATTFGVMGKMAAEMLPILKNLMEGLMFAVFPFVGLAILFPNGWKAFGYYAKMLLWIGLWPVAFALMHYAMTYFGSFAVQKVAAYYDFSGNLVPARYDIYTQMGIKQVMEKYEAIAGYMMTMIPMVTYVMVAQGGAMMAGMVGRIMDGYAKPAESAAMEASAGNFSVGNVNFDNQRAFAHTSAPTQVGGYVMTDNGLQQTIHGKGATITQFQENKLPIVSNLVQQVGSQQQAEHAKAVEHTQQTGAALANATQNLQRQLTSNGSSLNQTTTNGDNVTNSNGTMTSDTATHINQAARDWLSQNQHSDATIRKLAADWKVGTSFQSNEQFIGKLAAYITGGKIEASAGVSGGISGTTTNADIQQLSERFATSETLQHALTKQATQQIAQLNNQSTTGSIEQRETLEKSLANMRTASDQHSSALSESERISQSISSFKGMSAETRTSLTGVINKRIMEEMGEQGRYEAVAAFNNGDMDNRNLKEMMNIANKVMAEHGISSVNVKQHEAEIRADAAKGQSEILAQKPSSVPSNGTKQQVLKMQENHEQEKDVTETFIGFAGVDVKDKQDGVLDEAKRINQDVSNQVGVIRPDVRHADSGSTVYSNVVTDLMDKTQNVGVEKK